MLQTAASTVNIQGFGNCELLLHNPSLPSQICLSKVHFDCDHGGVILCEVCITRLTRSVAATA